MKFPQETILLVSFFALIGCGSAGNPRFGGSGALPNLRLFGKWEGQGTINVGWCVKKELKVSLAILEDGSVYGQIGDAVFNGRIRETRRAFGDFFAVKTDYAVDGRLDGPIVRDEGIERRRVRMDLDLRGGQLLGSLETEGPATGDKDTMRFTAVFLTLRKSAL